MSSRAGVLLRAMRRQARLTQEQLAERSEVSVSTIRRLENGKPIDPRMGTVKLIADALGTTAAERRRLLAEFGAPPDPADADDPAGPPAAPAPPVADSPVSRALADAAGRLAHLIGSRWRREEEQRRLHDPFPLPVRWQPAPAELTDGWDNVCRVRPGGTAAPVDLAGDPDELVAVYRRIPSGRLVVLGRAGSGKTILTLRFVLDYLQVRTGADPVPMVVGLGSWDPASATLRDWLIERLPHDYPDCPDLAESQPGRPTLAATLVEGGYILPVLDGFDEIAAGLRAAAMEALGATALPFLLTSRVEEYASAVAATDVPSAAAGIQLVDLTPGDLADYLPRTTRRTRGAAGTGTVWEPVLTELRDRPESLAAVNLAAALTTPLMVALARTAYSDGPGRDPAALLDTARFPVPGALEHHLLAAFVPAVYRRRPPHLGAGARPLLRPGWDPERAARWLGHLARHVDRSGGRDLAWWQLGRSLPRSSRVLAVTSAATLAVVLASWLVFVPADLIGSGLAVAIREGVLDGLLIGPTAGLAFGLAYGLLAVRGGLVFQPSRVQLRLRGHRNRTGRRLARAYAARFGTCLLGGFVVGLGYGPVSTLLRGLLFGFPADSTAVIEKTLVNTMFFGLIFGLVAGFVSCLAATLETPLDVGSAATPLGLLAANRRTTLRQLLMLVPTIALGIAFGGRAVVELLQAPFGPLRWPLSTGLLIGAVSALGGGLSYVLAFTAWGQWLLLTRVWLPLTGRLPWAVTAFLDDAYHRGVLRQAGAVYEFRHARLQDYLGQASRTQPAELP
ncbi:helix-turn-helix domain-containing protein [Amycolatopsis sp. PS_44_ISF1]|uniref:helix-turn-helix domain-containing protein n=1 Tax=Amycolatopsis sp. PS_44_ISF1 TaxID=2974917 RepID=UPI0028DFFAFB|nr:helix-turn-helix domain-containing protein [Amycolatopsis sp. PS_44_ISF1]MDT8912028.1 helix-turn-helix domain-containing protein [Amycolatopsis sp. PS_44_ISF1]